MRSTSPFGTRLSGVPLTYSSLVPSASWSNRKKGHNRHPRLPRGGPPVDLLAHVDRVEAGLEHAERHPLASIQEAHLVVARDHQQAGRVNDWWANAQGRLRHGASEHPASGCRDICGLRWAAPSDGTPRELPAHGVQDVRLRARHKDGIQDHVADPTLLVPGTDCRLGRNVPDTSARKRAPSFCYRESHQGSFRESRRAAHDRGASSSAPRPSSSRLDRQLLHGDAQPSRIIQCPSFASRRYSAHRRSAIPSGSGNGARWRPRAALTPRVAPAA